MKLQIFIVTRTARRYWLVSALPDGEWVEYAEISKLAAMLLKKDGGIEVYRDRGMTDPV
jgi:hypothetical protein